MPAALKQSKREGGAQHCNGEAFAGFLRRRLAFRPDVGRGGLLQVGGKFRKFRRRNSAQRLDVVSEQLCPGRDVDLRSRVVPSDGFQLFDCIVAKHRREQAAFERREIEAFNVIQRLAGNKITASEWLSQCAMGGITDIDLATVVTEAPPATP